MHRSLVLVAVAPLVASLAVVLPAAASDDTVERVVVGELRRVAVELRHEDPVEVTLLVPDAGPPVVVPESAFAGVETGATVAVTSDAPVPTAAELELTVDAAEVLAAAEADVSTVEVVSDGTEPGSTFAPLAALISGERPVHLVRGVVGTATDTVTEATLRDDVVRKVAPYWAESTDGALRFSVASYTDGGVFSGWDPAVHGCTIERVIALMDWAVAEAGVPASSSVNAGVHTVVYTPRVTACGGLAGVGEIADGGAAWVNGGTTAQRWATMTHELGHTLGLGHSNSRVSCAVGREDGSSADGCRDAIYGDAYDVMGISLASTGPGLLNAAHLDTLGLLSSTSTTFASGPATVTLASVGSGTGKRFLRFVSSGRTYYVEYRTPAGRDADLNSVLSLSERRRGCPTGVSLCTRSPYPTGVVVRVVDTRGLGAASALLEAGRTSVDTAAAFALPVGRTLTTRDGLLDLTVTGQTATSATVRLMPSAPAMYASTLATGDVTGDGRADVFTVDPQGRLLLHPGRGNGGVLSPAAVGTGWAALRVSAPGDWNGDGPRDVLAVDGEGRLWLYPGTGSGTLRSRLQIGHGWTDFRIVPVGDANGDRRNDLLAIDGSGRLWLYPGDGAGGFRARVQVGNGWGGYGLHTAGDMNRDGRIDILSIDTAGRLWFYAGRGGGFFSQRVQAGNGWNGYDFASGADLNGDGLSDLLGVDPERRLWFYAGRGPGSFAMKAQVGSRW